MGFVFGGGDVGLKLCAPPNNWYMLCPSKLQPKAYMARANMCQQNGTTCLKMLGMPQRFNRLKVFGPTLWCVVLCCAMSASLC